MFFQTFSILFFRRLKQSQRKTKKVMISSKLIKIIDLSFFMANSMNQHLGLRRREPASAELRAVRPVRVPPGAREVFEGVAPRETGWKSG